MISEGYVDLYFTWVGCLTCVELSVDSLFVLNLVYYIRLWS
jgi:hypothetical protein